MRTLRQREVKQFAAGHTARIKPSESVVGATKHSTASVMVPVFQVGILKVWGGGGNGESSQDQMVILEFGPSNVTLEVILKPHSVPPSLWKSILRRGGWACESQVRQGGVFLHCPSPRGLIQVSWEAPVLAHKCEHRERVLHNEGHRSDPGRGALSLKSGEPAVGRKLVTG